MATQGNGGGLSRWLVRALSRLLVLALAFVAGAVAMHVGMHGGDREHMQALQAQNAQLQAQLAQSQAAVAEQHNQGDVQDGSQRALQDRITELQKTLSSTQDQLSFYEQLLPPGPAGAVAVRAFDVQPQNGFLQYRVLLTRSVAESADPFKGRLRFVATGQQDGKTVQVELTSSQAGQAPQAGPVAQKSQADHEGQSAAVAAGGAGGASAADPQSLAFDQYQRSTGLLKEVPGLKIQSVRVDVLEGDTVRASRNVNLGGAAPQAAPGQ